MANFDFSTLNSSDFEELVCDLLNVEEKQSGSQVVYRTFKDGKDKGIDILYSTPDNDYEIVGQAKHFFKSGYNLLVSRLRNEEKQKVVRLNPGKYFIATSIDLSVANSQEIRDIFSPYIKSLSDVYGKKDLNSLLEKFPQILTRHFKLWYSSSQILSKITTFEIHGRSNEFREHDLKRRLRLYVETESLSLAREILENNHFVIVTGEPGAGKTCTAEMLLYEYIKNGYQLAYLYDDIREVERMLDVSADTKQIFYFDDFLGHNAVEIEKAKGSETALLRILRRLSTLKNKKLIFTTRTFILNSAVEESENLRRFNIKAKASIVDLQLYTEEIRLQLLKNHCEESQLKEELKEVLGDSNVLDFIINHRNFSPRSVEFITANDHSDGFSPENFELFIRENFDKPDEIWRHAYEQQIDDIDRFLLNTMVSFGYSVDLNKLELAFQSRLDYEVQLNNFKRPMDAFKRSFRKLENGFIIQETHDSQKYQFINPSLVDFLVNHLRGNMDEVQRISESAAFLAQLTTRMFPLNANDHKNRISQRLKKRLLKDTLFFIKAGTEDIDRLTLIILLYRYFEIEDTSRRIFSLFSGIEDWFFLCNNYELRNTLLEFLMDIQDESFKLFIKERGQEMFAQLFINEYNIEKIFDLIKLAKKTFDFDWKDLIAEDSKYGFSEHLSFWLEDRIARDIEDLLGYSNAADFVDEKEQSISKIVDRFNKLGFNVKVNLSEYGKYDWWQIGIDNYIQEQMRKND